MALKTMHAMICFQGASGLPEDVIVNGFNFRHATETGQLEADDFTEVRAALEGFFTATAAQGALAAQVNALGYYLSPWINRAATMRLYDMNEEKPRTPIISSFTLANEATSTGYAEEACCVLSFRTTTPNSPRRRGRIFFGPHPQSPDAVIPGSRTGPCRIAPTMENDLLRAANRLSAASVGMRWVTLSSHDSDTTVHPVVYAWVDNALDTQRRRGASAGARLTLDLQQPS